jgi:hypothetical protein
VAPATNHRADAALGGPSYRGAQREDRLDSPLSSLLVGLVMRLLLLWIPWFACHPGGKDPADTSDDTDEPADSDLPVETDEVDTDETDETDVESPCVADFDVTILQTMQTVKMTCVDYTAEATFEFDPDTKPQVRTAHLELMGRAGVDVECRLALDLVGLCGPQFYGVGPALSARVQTFDCQGIPDDQEGEFNLNEGYVHLDRVRTDGELGASSGATLALWFSGSLELHQNDIVVAGTFDVRPVVVGRDAEQETCLGTDVDLGAPVLRGTATYSLDSKPAFEATNPDCTAVTALNPVATTVTHNGCPACDVMGTVRPTLISGTCEQETGDIEFGLDTTLGRLYKWNQRQRNWDTVYDGVVGFRSWEGSVREVSVRSTIEETTVLSW